MAEYKIEGRDIMGLDRQGGYYQRHVQAMTREGLHWKGDIAAELGWRDAEIDRLKAAVEKARGDIADALCVVADRSYWGEARRVATWIRRGANPDDFPFDQSIDFDLNLPAPHTEG